MKMKKMLLIAFVMIFAASIASAASIVNSAHDMRTHLTNETNTEVCVYCHTPHQSGTTVDPLWNHTLSSTATYGTYSSGTLNATPTELGGNTTVSNLCMSCHDGTVAVNTLYNPPNVGTTGNPYTVTGTANLGTDLTNDHPVEFTYDDALVTADGGLNTVANVSAYLIGGRVTCASCHQVHDPQFQPFLRTSNDNSALCLACHVK